MKKILLIVLGCFIVGLLGVRAALSLPRFPSFREPPVVSEERPESELSMEEKQDDAVELVYTEAIPAMPGLKGFTKPEMPLPAVFAEDRNDTAQ